MAGQQYSEGQRLQGSDGKVYVVRGGVPVPEGAPIRPQGQVIKQGDPRQPFIAPLSAAELAAKGQEAAARSVQLERDRIKLADEQEAFKASHVKASGDKHGDAYLATLPASVAAQVRGYANGNLSFGTRPMANPASAAMLQHVVNFDPSFDMTDYNARAKANAAFRSGAWANQGIALNTALEHGNAVLGDIGRLNNRSGIASLLNPVENFVARHQDDPRMNSFESDRDHFAAELAKVFAGGNSGSGTLADRQGEAAAIPLNAGPNTQRDVLKHDALLMRSRLNALEYQARQSLGPNARITDFLSPEAKAAYQQLIADQQPASAQPDQSQQQPFAAPGMGAQTPPSSPMPPPLDGGGGRAIGGPGMPGGPPAPMNGTQQFYRNPTAGPDGGISVPTDGMISVPDPQRGALAAKLSAMVGDRNNPDQAIIQFAQKSGLGVSPGLLAQLKFRKDNPGYTGAYKASGYDFRDVPMSWDQRLQNTVGSSAPGAAVLNAGLSFGQLGNGLTGGALEHAFGDPAQNRTVINAINAQHPTAATIGSVAGGLVGAAGAEAAAAKGLAKVGLGKFAQKLAPIIGDAGFGALQGAGSAQDGQRLNGAMLGGVFGAGGGMFGRAATKAAGGVLGGVQNSAVQGLKAAGVPLTFAQAVSQSGRLGAAAKSVEDAMTHLPLVGNMISARRTEGVRGFNQAAFREALDPIKTAPIDAVAEPGIDAAKQAVGQGYDNALGGVQVAADAPFGMDYGAAMRAGNQLPGDMAGQARFSLDKRVGDSFGPGGVMDGNAIQQSLRGLGRDERSMAPLPFGHDFGNVTDQAAGAIEGMVNRQAPGVMPSLRAANTANRNVSTLTDAVDAARNGGLSGETGLFMPSQLANAASKNARRFGGTQGTTNQPFFDLSRAGQAVLPSKIGDSGTAIRALVGGTVLGGGTGLGALAGDTESGAEAGGGALLALALGGSKAAQRALVASVLKRPQSFKYAGNALRTAGAPIGGMFGAAASPLMLPSP